MLGEFLPTASLNAKNPKWTGSILNSKLDVEKVDSCFLVTWRIFCVSLEIWLS